MPNRSPVPALEHRSEASIVSLVLWIPCSICPSSDWAASLRSVPATRTSPCVAAIITMSDERTSWASLMANSDSSSLRWAGMASSAPSCSRPSRSSFEVLGSCSSTTLTSTASPERASSRLAVPVTTPRVRGRRSRSNTISDDGDPPPSHAMRSARSDRTVSWTSDWPNRSAARAPSRVRAMGEAWSTAPVASTTRVGTDPLPVRSDAVRAPASARCQQGSGRRIRGTARRTWRRPPRSRRSEVRRCPAARRSPPPTEACGVDARARP